MSPAGACREFVAQDIDRVCAGGAGCVFGFFLDVCVFITAGPMIKLCAGGEGDSEGHVL
jgi:hypothetical protein